VGRQGVTQRGFWFDHAVDQNLPRMSLLSAEILCESMAVTVEDDNNRRVCVIFKLFLFNFQIRKWRMHLVSAEADAFAKWESMLKSPGGMFDF
jgi:hypothetical protein